MKVLKVAWIIDSHVNGTMFDNLLVETRDIYHLKLELPP